MNESHAEHDVAIPAGPGTTLHFSEAEWQQFRTSDMAAGRAVVVLMASIFIIGLLLYSTIDYLIW
jgi:hypothetical protein